MTTPFATAPAVTTHAHESSTGAAPLLAPRPVLRRTRGPARSKLYRKPTTGKAHEQRVLFGEEWGAFNSREAKLLRSGAK